MAGYHDHQSFVLLRNTWKLLEVQKMYEDVSSQSENLRIHDRAVSQGCLNRENRPAEFVVLCGIGKARKFSVWLDTSVLSYIPKK